MPASQPDLSIVIPAYREAKRIGRSLDKLADFLKSDPTLKGKKIEVLVVAADTTDNTHSIVLNKRKKFTSLVLLRPGPKVGKGRDVKHGMLRATGKAVIFMDADLATPLRYLPIFYRYHQDGFDVVIATRNLRRHHPNFWRRLLSNGGNLIFRLASGIWVEDSQCGFKLFSDQASKVCFSKLNLLGWGFDMEVLAIAKAQKFTTKTYRVDDWESVPNGVFNEGLVKNSLTSLAELGHIFVRRIRGSYK